MIPAENHAMDDVKEGFLTDQAIRNQLERVLSSDRFADSNRLRSILRFLVEETLKGRATEMKGYTVGREVFGLGNEFDAQSNCIVRVAVKRLRTALDDYYQGDGRSDPIRISLPLGSYVPNFWPKPPVHAAVDPEVETLYDEANALLNPPSFAARLLAGRELFRFLTELEPSFPGGFSGASLTYCYAVIFGHSKKRQEDLHEAVRLAKQAVSVDDSFAEGYAVLGLALALRGDIDGSRVQTDLAVERGPTNPWAHAWRGVACGVSGDHPEAIRSLEEAVRLAPNDPRKPYLNMLGTVCVIDEQYQRARDAMVRNVERKGPDGPHMMALRAIAFANTGSRKEARHEVEKLRREWPDYSVRQWLSNFAGAEEHQARWLALLGDLGWAGE